MIIFDNIIFAIQNTGGGSTYWHAILSRLLRDKKQIETLNFHGCEKNVLYQELADKIPCKVSSKGIFWRITNPFKSSQNLIENCKRITHSSYYRFSRCKSDINIVTIHDFIPELFFPIHRRIFNKLLKRYCLNNADAVICVSESTKKDLLRFFPRIRTKKIVVIPNGVDEDFYCEQTTIGNYFLFVGARRKYKNFDKAVEQVSLSHLSKMVVVGKEFNETEKHILSKHQDVEVIRFSGLDKNELRKVYNEAFALLHPSIYEGFGLTSIEALLAGCPVIAFGCPAIKEVLDGWDLCYTDFKSENFIKLNNKLRYNYDEYVGLGKNLAKGFSWENSYKNHINLYEKLLKTK